MKRAGNPNEAPSFLTLSPCGRGQGEGFFSYSAHALTPHPIPLPQGESNCVACQAD